MRILLIDPPLEDAAFSINLSIPYLSACLRYRGHTVSVLDMMNFNTIESPENRLKNAVKSFEPDAIGFSVANLSYLNTIKLVDSLRHYYYGIVVCGGPEVTAQGKCFLEKINGVDFAVIGEGEEALCEILEHLENKLRIQEIRGIVYHSENNNEIISALPRELRKDLDSLPLPDFDVLGLKQFDLYSILTSRGCPFSCIFCATEARGKSWRIRDLTLCIEELKIAKEKYNIKGFQILDPVFNLRPERVEEFCELIIQEKINLPWFVCGMRADRLTDSSARMMKKARCERIAVGVESFDEEVARFMNKGEDINTVKKGIKIALENGLTVAGYMLMGLPFDTFKKTIKSYEEARKLNMDELLYQDAVPFTGTELEKWVKHNAKVLKSSFEVNTMRKCLDEFPYETIDFKKPERSRAKFILSIKSHSYFDPNATKLILYLKKIYFILLYDYKHIHDRLRQSYKYRKKYKGQIMELLIERRAEYRKLPDGTWGLSNDGEIKAAEKGYIFYLKDGRPLLQRVE